MSTSQPDSQPMSEEQLGHIDELLGCYKGLVIEGMGIVSAATDLRAEVSRLTAELAISSQATTTIGDRLDSFSRRVADLEKRECELLRECDTARSEASALSEHMNRVVYREMLFAGQYRVVCGECFVQKDSPHGTGCKMGRLLDGTAAASLQAELVGLRERVKELEGQRE